MPECGMDDPAGESGWVVMAEGWLGEGRAEAGGEWWEVSLVWDSPSFLNLRVDFSWGHCGGDHRWGGGPQGFGCDG